MDGRCDSFGWRRGCWHLIVNNQTLPPRKKKIIWKLPDSIDETPKFGEHEKKRLWEISKQQKKERRKNLKQQPKGGSAASSTSPPPSTNGAYSSKVQSYNMQASPGGVPPVVSIPDERRPPDDDDKQDPGLKNNQFRNGCNAATVPAHPSESVPLHPATPPGFPPPNHQPAPPPGFAGTDGPAEQHPFLFNQIKPSDDDPILSLGPANIELFGSPGSPTYYSPHTTLTIFDNFSFFHIAAC